MIRFFAVGYSAAAVAAAAVVAVTVGNWTMGQTIDSVESVPVLDFDSEAAEVLVVAVSFFVLVLTARKV